MPLFFNKTVNNRLQLVVWELTESLEFFKDRVAYNEERLESIKVEEKKREYLAGKFVLEKAAELQGMKYIGCQKDEHGKPFLVAGEYEISLTHTSDYIGVVFCEGSPVGIDIERPRDQIFRVLPRLYTPDELQAVGDDKDKATVYWSAKEALYKLYGKRSVDFRKNLFLHETPNGLEATIKLKDHFSQHKFYIERLREYFLVVAY